MVVHLWFDLPEKMSDFTWYLPVGPVLPVAGSLATAPAKDVDTAPETRLKTLLFPREDPSTGVIILPQVPSVPPVSPTSLDLILDFTGSVSMTHGGWWGSKSFSVSRVRLILPVLFKVVVKGSHEDDVQRACPMEKGISLRCIKKNHATSPELLWKLLGLLGPSAAMDFPTLVGPLPEKLALPWLKCTHKFLISERATAPIYLIGVYTCLLPKGIDSASFNCL